MAIKSQQDCVVPTYQKASWKNVPFEVESSSDEFGRRGDLYEYPLSEDTAYKDLGRKARRFKVEGYLIGSNQVALTLQMKKAAESPEPGTLVHPMYGSQRVACVTLTASADYKRDKRRTKLSFEFVEANESNSPFQLGGKTPGQVEGDASAAADASKDLGSNSIESTTVPSVAGNLSDQVTPASDELSHDVQDRLNSLDPSAPYTGVPTLSQPPLNIQSMAVDDTADTRTITVTVPTFRSFADAIDDGTATIRRLHDDALIRLREFNRFVVEQAGAPDVEIFIMTTRLLMIRDFAVKAAMTKYKTIQDALRDLDFVMSVYDEEELAAMRKCADPLVAAIRQARATAAQAILTANIRLPGVVQIDVVGVWPSLVAAHKVYFDGRRYADVENYNPQMSPFFVGRDVITPAPEVTNGG